jgi:hypothetical protein
MQIKLLIIKLLFSSLLFFPKSSKSKVWGEIQADLGHNQKRGKRKRKKTPIDFFFYLQRTWDGEEQLLQLDTN